MPIGDLPTSRTLPLSRSGRGATVDDASYLRRTWGVGRQPLTSRRQPALLYSAFAKSS